MSGVDYLRLLEPFAAHVTTFDNGEALRLLGVRDQVHPFDVHAVRYPSVKVARLYARANREMYGHGTLGPIAVEGVGVIAAVDLRASLRHLGHTPTDPGLPDRPLTTTDT